MVQASRGSSHGDSPGADHLGEQSLEELGIVAIFKIARLAHSLSPDDLIDVGAIRIIVTLAEVGPIRLSDLAQESHLDLSTVSRHAAALEKQGLVRRSADPDDRRACHVELTQKAFAFLHQMLNNRVDAIAPAMAQWDPADRDQLFTLLIRLAEDLRQQVLQQREATA